MTDFYFWGQKYERKMQHPQKTVKKAIIYNILGKKLILTSFNIFYLPLYINTSGNEKNRCGTHTAYHTLQ